MIAPIDTRSFYSSLYRDLAEELSASFKLFAQAAWPLVEPSTPFLWGRHHDVISEMLEDISAGYIKRWVVNIPPGCSKSILITVLWPAWEWTRRADLRYLCVSYSDKPSIRDNRRMRYIVDSDWYKRLFWTKPTNVSLASDQYAKVRFDTTERGWRIASSVDGMATSEHPDRLIMDDLLKASDSRSEAALQNANDWLQDTLPSRIARDPVMIHVAQRLHETDTSDYLLQKGGWTHTLFPMRFQIPYQDDDGKWLNNWKCSCHEKAPDPLDWRSEEGELLWPEKYNEAAVDAEEIELGPIQVAAQLQQNPSGGKGSLYSRDMFEIVEVLPAECRSAPAARGWDTADTDVANEKKKRRKGDWTVGVKIVGPVNGIFYVTHVIRIKEGPEKVDETILNTAEMDGKRAKIREGSGSGKATISRRTQELAGWDYEASPETDSKIERNTPFRVQAKAGNVKLLRGEWNSAYLDVLCSFPTGRFDDDVDGTSNAFNALAVRPKRRLRYALGR